MNRKVSLYLILGLILIGFIVTSVAAVECANYPNGDILILDDNGSIYHYYHNDTGTWETNYKNLSSSNGLTIYSIPKVSPGNANSYSNSSSPQTKPSPVIVKPLPTQGKTNAISRFAQYIK
jgi:hypothetical protein